MDKEKAIFLEKKFGIKIVKPHIMIDPRNLKKIGLHYQRFLELRRQKNIEESIKQYGYWPSQVITVNENHEIIDGQHRWRAALNQNISKVPICIVSFPSKEMEAEYFWHCNDYNTKLNQPCYWAARYEANDIIAKILYELEADAHSFFCNFIAIKGKQTSQSKLTIAHALSIIVSMTLDYSWKWERRYDKLIKRKIEALGYREISIRCNLFLKWFFDCFGNEKKHNPIAYNGNTIRAIISFFLLLKKQGFLNSQYINTVNKMRQFVFVSEFIRTPQIGKIHFFINHFNAGRSKNKLEYKNKDI